MIDAHLHLFSRPYFAALAARSPNPGTVPERLERLTKESGIQIPPEDLGLHVKRWLAEMDRGGVERAVAFSSAPEEAAAVREAALLSKGRLVGVALVDPKAEGAAARTRTLLCDDGFRGVLLFPAMHRYHLSSPEAHAVLEEVSAVRGVAYVQCGLLQVKVRDLLGLPRTVDLAYANPLGVVPPADAFPAVSFVIPHLGAGFLREALMAGSQCRNVHVDTSSSNSWLSTQAPPLDLAGALEAALAVFGPGRVLFGTDSSTFPRGWRSDLFRLQDAALSSLGLPASDLAQVFGGNAARVLAL